MTHISTPHTSDTSSGVLNHSHSGRQWETDTMLVSFPQQMNTCHPCTEGKASSGNGGGRKGKEPCGEYSWLVTVL